jgi:hypothetical protein
MLTAMPFSGDCAALAPIGDSRAIRLRQIAEDQTIGSLVADAGLLALVLERHLDGKPDCPADTGLRDSRVGVRCLLCSDRLSPVAEDRPHFYVPLCAPHTPTHRPAGRPSRAGSACSG